MGKAQNGLVMKPERLYSPSVLTALRVKGPMEVDADLAEALLRDTAAGIPNARLILYEGTGHAPTAKQFGRDVLAFLREGMPEDA